MGAREREIEIKAFGFCLLQPNTKHRECMQMMRG